MDYDLDRLLAITRETIEFNDMSGGSDSELTNRTLHRTTRYEDDIVVFYKEDR